MFLKNFVEILVRCTLNLYVNVENMDTVVYLFAYIILYL